MLEQPNQIIRLSLYWILIVILEMIFFVFKTVRWVNRVDLEINRAQQKLREIFEVRKIRSVGVSLLWAQSTGFETLYEFVHKRNVL